MADALGRGSTMGPSQVDATGAWVPADWTVAPEVLAIAYENLAAASALPVDTSEEEDL